MNRREFTHLTLVTAATVLLPKLARAGQPARAIVDTHAHVFRRDLPMVPGRRYTPDYDATVEDYLGVLDANGVARGVLVQPSFLGTDNHYLLAALRRHPQRLRGVAVVAPAVSAGELEELEGSGIVGLRLNLFGQPLPDFTAVPWPALLRQIAKLNWHIEIHREAKDLPVVLPPLLEAGVKIVVDHFGRPDPQLGIEDPGFRALLGMGASRRVWVKLSGAYRNGSGGRGAAIARAGLPLLLPAFGTDRLVWASDWPHTQFEKTESYAAVCAERDTWFTNAAERTAILETTPAKLFHFT
ncbi:MAG: amidohydrolase family protein [Opitutaceae bacterium]